MLIALAIVAAIALPVVYIRLSNPDIQRANRALNPDVFLATIEKCLKLGDVGRARKLCAAAGLDTILSAGTLALLSNPSHAHDGIMADMLLASERLRQELREFSFRRLCRDLIAVATPVAIMLADEQGDGWVIAPLTISMLVMAAIGYVARMARHIAIAKLAETPRVLGEIQKHAAVVQMIYPPSQNAG